MPAVRLFPAISDMRSGPPIGGPLFCCSGQRSAPGTGPGLDLVEGRVGEVDVPGVHLLFAQAETLAEVSNLSKSLGTQCLQGFRGFCDAGRALIAQCL